MNPAHRFLTRTLVFALSMTPLMTFISMPARAGIITATSANELFTYSVFAKETITSRNSDYQGMTGAGGDVTLSNFYIKTILLSAGAVKISDGTVGGSIFAKSVQLSHAGAQSAHATAAYVPTALELSNQMDAASVQLSSLPATVAVSSDEYGNLIHAQGVTVVMISTATLSSGKNLMIEGAATDTVVINISGSRAEILHTGIFVRGGITANRIIFNFSDAIDVTIALSGGPNYGIPGTILAPNAALHFANALVTGAIFARTIDAEIANDPTHSFHGGQVNIGCFEGVSVAVGCGMPPLPHPPKPTPTR